MSACVCVFILTLSTLHGATVVSGVLSGPTNVSLTSYNMDLVLRWDPPEGAAGDLVYTSEYRSRFALYRATCTNSSELQCDISRHPDSSIPVYGKFTGRVRAQLGAEISDWVESKEMSLDEDTIIGPPDVSLSSTEDTIDVSITDPVFARGTLKEVYGSTAVTYEITYWREGHEEEAASRSKLQQNRIVLDNLERWTSYCVQARVKVNTRKNPNPGEPSTPVCERTTSMVSGVLSGPTNVSLTSYNMDLVLRWDPPEGAAGDLVYTSEYRSRFALYRATCTNSSELQCDISRHPDSSIPVYGRFTGRVRAQLGAEISDWVESKEMSLDEDTIIGPPDVSLSSTEDTIDVSITDPVFARGTLKEAYGSTAVTYEITYWREGHEEEAASRSKLQQNRIVLDNLERWTSYCVQARVKVNTRKNPNPGEPSTPVCERTTSKPEVPWVAAVVTFVVIAAALAALALTVVYRKRISNLLCPKVSLPQRFKEAPKSPMYMAMRDSHPPKEHYDPVSIVADDGAVEEGRPLQDKGTSCSLGVRES